MWDVRQGRSRREMEEVRAERLQRVKGAVERRRAKGA